MTSEGMATKRFSTNGTNANHPRRYRKYAKSKNDLRNCQCFRNNRRSSGESQEAFYRPFLLNARVPPFPAVEEAFRPVGNGAPNFFWPA